MANNVGLDFGTTYSIISHLKDIDKTSSGEIVGYNFEACKPSEGASYFQDSIVVRNLNDDEEPLITGSAAREYVGESSSCVYDGFKMLLSEPLKVDNTINPLLSKKHYDETFNPKYITKTFLDNLLDTYFERYHNSDATIDKMVVGIPEIWFEENKAYACSDILEEILRNNSRINTYELVSEPALACAFFVENYKKRKQADFEGNVLVIDYGGGTLDISLCKVGINGGTNSISIPVKAGAGINQEGVTGKAGLAFIEKVVLLTLEDNDINESAARAEKHFHSNKFKVEKMLMLDKNITKMTREFRMNEGSDLSKLDGEFCKIEYKGEDYSVTYGALVRAFNTVIKDVLVEKLQEMEDRMVEQEIITRTYETLDNGKQKKQIDYGPNFKIVTIGGFCNFYLTQEEIKDFYEISSSDDRVEDVCCTREERELAVSYGAALVANDIINFKHTVQYTHYVVANGEKVFKVVDMGTEIKENEIHYASYPDGRHAIFSGKRIPKLRLSPGRGRKVDEDPGNKLPIPENSTVKIGFSFSKTGTIKIHIFELDNDDRVKGEPHVIKLKDVYTIFGEMWAWEDEE